MAPDGTVARVMGPGARWEGLQARRGEEVRCVEFEQALNKTGSDRERGSKRNS